MTLPTEVGTTLFNLSNTKLSMIGSILEDICVWCLPSEVMSLCCLLYLQPVVCCHQVSNACTQGILLIWLVESGYLDHFDVLSILNKTARVLFGGQRSLCIFGTHLGVESLVHPCMAFRNYNKIVFQHKCTNLSSLKAEYKFCWFHGPAKISAFKILTTPWGEKLISQQIMMNECVIHTFVCLLATWQSPFEIIWNICL